MPMSIAMKVPLRPKPALHVMEGSSTCINYYNVNMCISTKAIKTGLKMEVENLELVTVH